MKGAVNAVFPTGYYMAVEGLVIAGTQEQTPRKGGGYTAAETSAAKKLNALLNRAYTVVAEQDGVIFGLASMDRQGNLGLMYVDGNEYKKTVKLLIRALERLAVKKQVPDIFVAVQDSVRKIFKECGYLPPENAGKSAGEEGQTPLCKSIIERAASVEFLPENVRRITLDSRKPIVAEGTVHIFPLLLFGLSCFFAVILIFIGLAEKSGGKVEGYENLPLFIIIVGVMFSAALCVLIADRIRLKSLKKKILAGWITNGVITEYFSETRRTHRGSGDSREGSRYVDVYLTYVFYDEAMNLHTAKFSHKYQGRAPFFCRGLEIVVAYRGGTSYILSRYTVLKDEAVLSEQTERQNN